MRGITYFAAVMTPAVIALVFNATPGRPIWALLAFGVALVAGSMLMHTQDEQKKVEVAHVFALRREYKRANFLTFSFDKLLRKLFFLLKDEAYWLDENATPEETFACYEMWRDRFIATHGGADVLIDILMEGRLPGGVKLPETTTLVQYKELFQDCKKLKNSQDV